MIKWNVRTIAESKGWNIGQLAEAAEIAYSSALDLWHGRPRRVDLAVLNRLCNALECSPCDVLAYEPGEMPEGYTESPGTEVHGSDANALSTGLSVFVPALAAA